MNSKNLSLKKIVSHVHQIEMLLRRIDTFIRPIRDQWNIISRSDDRSSGLFLLLIFVLFFCQF